MAACGGIVALGGLAVWLVQTVEPTSPAPGIEIVRQGGDPGAVAKTISSPPSMERIAGTGSSPTGTTAPAARTHYGAPVELADPLLDTALARAPSDILIRHRLLAMQLAIGHDAAAEDRMTARLVDAWGAEARHVRIRCSVSVCEATADLPKLAARVVSDPAAFAAPATPSCQADPGMASWTDGTLAVRYMSQSSC